MFRLRVATFICMLAAACSTFAQAIDVQAALNAQKGAVTTGSPKPKEPVSANEVKPPAAAGSASSPSATIPAAPSGCKMETLMLRTANAAAAAVDEIDLQVSETAIAPRQELTLSMRLGSELAKCIGATSGPVLFLDHLPIQGLAPTGRFIENGRVLVRFRLDRPASSTTNWNELIQRAWTEGKDREVFVGFGGGDSEVAVSAKPITLRLGGGSPSVGVGVLLLCVVVLALIWRTSKALADRKPGELSYSLSRLVLACWVLTTIAAIALVLYHTGVLPSVADGGLAFMVAATGLGTGASSLMDWFKKATNSTTSTLIQDFFEDSDGFALHRVQSAILNGLVLYVVWRELVLYGTVANVDKSWALLVGASTVTYLLGKTGETLKPTVEQTTS